MSIASDFIETSTRRLKYYKELGEKTFEQLSDADFHFTPNEESNSIAVIIRHLHGNMLSRWTNFLEEDGEKEWRRRDEEFANTRHTREELLAFWEAGWVCFLNAIIPLTKKELKGTITVRGESLTVIDAINRQLAHYPYHVGQIVFIGKLIKNTGWKNLSIPRGSSHAYNKGSGLKDPAKTF